VREVVKRRRTARLAWQGAEVEIALDVVSGLGDYLELELLAAADEVPAAQARIEALARELGVGPHEPRSYLEMVLATAEDRLQPVIVSGSCGERSPEA
jgi:adenylate cyclase class IV